MPKARNIFPIFAFKVIKLITTGVYYYPEGVTVEYRDGVGIAVNYSEKAYQLNIPAGAQILVGNRELPTAGVTVWKFR